MSERLKGPEAGEVPDRLRLFWRREAAPALLLAGVLGAWPAWQQLPQREYFEALLMGQATILGFLLLVLIFVFEQQQQAVRAAMRIADSTRRHLRSLGATALALSAASALLNLWLISRPIEDRRAYGWVAGSTTAVGIVAALLGVWLLVRALSPKWATDRVIVRTAALRTRTRPSKRRAAIPRARTRSLDRPEIQREIQREIDELTTLARAEAERGDVDAFTERVRGLSSISRGDTSTLVAGDAALDALVVLVGANIERREFALRALDALKRSCRGDGVDATTTAAPAPSPDDVAALLDRLVSVLRRLSRQESPSARFVSGLLEVPEILRDAHHHVDPRGATTSLVRVAVQLGCRGDVPRDVVAAITDGVAALLRTGAVEPTSLALPDEGSAADPSVRQRWRRIAIPAIRRSGVGRATAGSTAGDADTAPALTPASARVLEALLAGSVPPDPLPVEANGQAPAGTVTTTSTEELAEEVLLLTAGLPPDARWLDAVEDRALRARIIAAWLVDGALAELEGPAALEPKARRLLHGEEGPADLRVAELAHRLQNIVWAEVAPADGAAASGPTRVDVLELSRAVEATVADRCRGHEQALMVGHLLREVFRKTVDRPTSTTRAPMIHEVVFVRAVGPLGLLDDVADDHVLRWSPSLLRSDLEDEPRDPFVAAPTGHPDPLQEAALELLDTFVGADAAAVPLRAMWTLLGLRMLEATWDERAAGVIVAAARTLDPEVGDLLRRCDPGFDGRVGAALSGLADVVTEGAADPARTAVLLGALETLMRSDGPSEPVDPTPAARLIVASLRRSRSAGTGGDGQPVAAARRASPVWSVVPAPTWTAAAELLEGPTDGVDFDAGAVRSLLDVLCRTDLRGRGEDVPRAVRRFFLALRGLQLRRGYRRGPALFSDARGSFVELATPSGEQMWADGSSTGIDGVVRDPVVGQMPVSVDIGNALLVVEQSRLRSWHGSATTFEAGHAVLVGPPRAP